MLKTIKRYYPPILELIPLALLWMAFQYTAINIDQLPDIIPSHFNARGLPDDWQPKGFMTTWFMPCMVLFVYLLMAGCNFLVMRASDPFKVINLPVSEKEKKLFSPEEMEAIRTAAVRGLWFLNVCTMALLCHLTIKSIDVALGRSDSIGWIFWVWFALVIIISIGLTIRLFQLSSIHKKDRKL